MLGAGATGMPKSVSWDHSYAAGLKIRADKAAEVACLAAHEDSRLKAMAASLKGRGGGGGGMGVDRSGGGHMPRSVSCSNFAPKRTLFPRTSSSKDELGRAGEGIGVRRGSSQEGGEGERKQRRRVLPRRRGVSFDTQVGELNGPIVLCSYFWYFMRVNTTNTHAASARTPTIGDRGDQDDSPLRLQDAEKQSIPSKCMCFIFFGLIECLLQ